MIEDAKNVSPKDIIPKPIPKAASSVGGGSGGGGGAGTPSTSILPTLSAPSPPPSMGLSGLVNGVPGVLPRSLPDNVKSVISKMSDTDARKEAVRIFEDWMILLAQGNQNDKAYLSFLNQYQALLKDEESGTHFFRTCIELCVESNLVATEMSSSSTSRPGVAFSSSHSDLPDTSRVRQSFW